LILVDVELRHLRSFIAVARCQSFTRAAKELLITQPALSRTIQQLEDAVAVTLIDRNSRHATLTTAGADFLTSAERIVNEFDQLVASTRQQATLRLGFAWLLPDPWAQQTLSAYENATGHAVTLVRCDDPLDVLERGAIDVAVVRGTVPKDSQVRVMPLFDEERVVVCSIHSDLASSATVAWRDVPKWPVVVNSVSGTTVASSWPDGHRPASVIETSNFDEWLECVAAGRGIGVVPDVAARRIVHPAVRFIPLSGAPKSHVSLVFSRTGNSDLVRRFLDAARTTA
jgi:DNA-binding transcriptional LysR family regulator